MQYIEIARGDKDGKPSIRNIIIEKGSLPKFLKEGEELYRSYYSYDRDILDHMRVYRTVSSHKGNFYLDRITLDVDRVKKKGIEYDEEVHLKVKIQIEELEEKWQLDRNQISTWYSGTGYHLLLPDIFHFTPSKFLPDEVKMTFAKYFPQMDPMPLMKTGLIRVGYSFNVKSNRYKIPLTIWIGYKRDFETCRIK